MKETINEQNAGARLDQYLTEKTNAPSRAHVQRNIKAGRASVNGTHKTPHYALRIEDVVEYDPTEEPTVSISGTTERALDIIAETDDFLVINKPSGITMHPAPGVAGPTLADLLLGHYPTIARVGEDPLRPGIVHRLDRDVSGVIVVAKTQNMFDHLKQQFKNRTIHKEYTALVYGTVLKDHDTINLPIGRSQTKGGRMAAHTQAYEKDRDARTIYTVIRRPSRYSLLSVSIATGRTHQIRVHLRAIGHPVVGDTVYAIKSIKPAAIDRIFLHARLLSFTALSGEPVAYTSELPDELTSFLSSLS